MGEFLGLSESTSSKRLVFYSPSHFGSHLKTNQASRKLLACVLQTAQMQHYDNLPVPGAEPPTWFVCAFVRVVVVLFHQSNTFCEHTPSVPCPSRGVPKILQCILPRRLPSLQSGVLRPRPIPREGLRDEPRQP